MRPNDQVFELTADARIEMKASENGFEFEVPIMFGIQDEKTGDTNYVLGSDVPIKEELDDETYEPVFGDIWFEFLKEFVPEELKSSKALSETSYSDWIRNVASLEVKVYLFDDKPILTRSITFKEGDNHLVSVRKFQKGLEQETIAYMDQLP
jgi:hypothetical protein|nr:MAG TPA: hypothetical protein [Caudoviricetes sp.]